MIWPRRCLVLVPVLSFLAAALIMSCGGGSSGGSTTVASFRSLVGLNVCLGPPPTTTPKPTPTNGHTPKATPTPICTPIVSRAFIESTAPGSNTVQFNAQGIFDLQNGSAKEKFNDVTNAANILWNPGQPNADFTGGITASGETNGEFIGTKEGCAYFVVSLSGFSQDVVIGVGVDPLSCPPAPGSQ
jgi:hypothetical protein